MTRYTHTDNHDRYNEQRNINLSRFNKIINLITCATVSCGLGAVAIFIFLIVKGVL